MMSPLLVSVALFMLVAFSIGGLLLVAVFPRLEAGKRTQGRMNSVAGVQNKASERVTGLTDDQRRRRSVEETIREIEETQRAKNRRHNKPTLVTRMRQGGLSWSRNAYFLFCAIAGIAGFIVGTLLIGLSLLPALGFAVALGLLVPHLYVGQRRKRRFKRFSNEFANAIDVIVRGIKAGLPLVDCLKVISTEAQEPVKSEFRQVVEDQTFGMPLSEAVARLPERVPVPEANFFAIVIAVQAKTGGSLSEALGNLSRVLRERKKMDGKIKAMSQEAKSSAAIIGSLPFVVGGLVGFVSPDYIKLLFTTSTGHMVMFGCAFWMFVGIMVMRKMINFDF
ncbi:tight adherence protein B [Faunimonas pinastri]|uniref:Tight adherence protein B n=1 Tax=Faunimonas pinastri TaxID=1855383 RepID=A0A1H9HH97_9HYPH|nr:type II secretion system F family protein [Faunimonas pinastri]SEQ61721.1 tight adherence protein B [Faunimonas pinastri]